MSRAKVARSAGVTRATVKHYAEIGLLPPPLLTSPNMGYYAPECVERIGLVRQLQGQRHLPLDVIARILEAEGAERVEHAFAVSRALRADLLDTLAGENSQPASREELLAIEGIDAGVLAELEDLALVRRLPGGGDPHYDATSADLVHAVGVMRAAGLNEASGFCVSDLRLYRERLAELVQMEIRLFSERVVGQLDTDQAERLMRSGLRDTSALVLAVRDRLLADFLDWALPDGDAEPSQPLDED